MASTNVPLPVFRNRRFWPTQVTRMSGKPSLVMSPTATPMPYSSTSRPAARVTSVNVPFRLLRYSAQRRALPLVAGPVHAVDEQDVLPAVGVVVEKRAAGPECFGQQLAAIGAAVVAEPQAGRRGDVDEREAGRVRAAAGTRGIEWHGRRGETRAAARQEVAPIHSGTDQPVLDGVDHELGGLVQAQGVHDVGAMDRDGVHAQVQLCGNRAVREAVADQLQDFELARREPVRAFLRAGCATAGSTTVSPAATRFTAAARSRSSAFFRM